MVITAIYQSLPERHPIFAQIGRVASAWAHFEQELDQSIIAISALDERSLQCVLTQFISSAPRIRAFIALCREKGIKDEHWYRSADKFLQKNNAIAEERNRVVHDPWMTDTANNLIFQRSVLSQKSKPKLSMELVLRTEEDMIAIIKKIDRHVLNFRTLRNELKNRHPELLLNLSSSLTYVTRSINENDPYGGNSVVVRPATKDELATMLAVKAARKKGEIL